MKKQMKRTAISMLLVFVLISATGPAYSFFGMIGGLIGNVLGGSSGGIGGLIGNIFGGLGGGGATSAVGSAAGQALTQTATNVAANQANNGGNLNGLSGVISSTGPVISNVAGGIVNGLGGKQGITNLAGGLFGKGGVFNGGIGTLGISGGQNSAAEQAQISKQLAGVDPSIRNTMMNFKMPTLSAIDPISKAMGPTLNNLGPKIAGVKGSGGAFLGVQSGTTANFLVDAANSTGLKFPTPKGFVQNPLGGAFPPLPKVPGMKWVQPPPPPFFPSFLPMPPVPPILVPEGEGEHHVEEHGDSHGGGGLLGGLLPGLGGLFGGNNQQTQQPQQPQIQQPQVQQPQIINDEPVVLEDLPIAMTAEVEIADNQVSDEPEGESVEDGSQSVSLLSDRLNGILGKIRRMKKKWGLVPKKFIKLNPGLCKQMKSLIRRLNPDNVREYGDIIKEIQEQFDEIKSTDAFKKLIKTGKRPYSLHLFKMLMKKYKKMDLMKPFILPKNPELIEGNDLNSKVDYWYGKIKPYESRLDWKPGMIGMTRDYAETMADFAKFLESEQGKELADYPMSLSKTHSGRWATIMKIYNGLTKQ